MRGSSSPATSRRGLFLSALVFTIVVAIGAAFFVTNRVRMSRARVVAGASSTQLSYPGARTIVNISGEDGGQVLQQETTDPFEKVSAWYESRIKPTKMIRATGTTVIMKNDNVTATIVGTVAGASIVIKQTAR